MELLKLASLIERHPRPEELPAAIAEINSLIAQTASAEQRELYQDSNLDELLLETERENLRRRKIVGEQSDVSLEAYLPIRGGGLMLSATDIDVYRTCPLRYKFARVYTIPKEQTLPQRFGILVHQVLERYHSQLANEEVIAGDRGDPRADARQADDAVRDRLAAARLRRLERGAPAAREGGRGAGALPRALRRRPGLDPVWFERSFSFRIGPHLLRGRVDRVDRHPDGSYELIDYKTGRARTPSQLKDDIQLSLYQLGARESWKLDSSRQSYYYVLDDEQVPLEPSRGGRDPHHATRRPRWRAGSSPRSSSRQPSFSACSICDFQLICPAAEK